MGRLSVPVKDRLAYSATLRRSPVAGVTVRWRATDPGVLRLSSGHLMRGRGLGRPSPEGSASTSALYVFPEPPPAVPWEQPWEHRWVLWPDFGLPGDSRDAADAFPQALRRTADERVEVACLAG